MSGIIFIFVPVKKGYEGLEDEQSKYKKFCLSSAETAGTGAVEDPRMMIKKRRINPGRIAIKRYPNIEASALATMRSS